MAIDNMEELFVAEIRHLYDAEQRLVKQLPKMAEAAYAADLRNTFEEHLDETRQHVNRLERILAHFGKKVDEKTSKAVKGLVEEVDDLISDTKRSPLRDAGLIAAGNKVEHFEMGAYGTVRTFARLLDQEEIAKLLEQTLQEEEAADKKLTKLAETLVNDQALQYQTT